MYGVTGTTDHQIDAATLHAGLHAPAEEPDQAEALRGFPTAQTAFAGHTKELAQIAQRLGDPACRLLTLLGPGDRQDPARGGGGSMYDSA